MIRLFLAVLCLFSVSESQAFLVEYHVDGLACHDETIRGSIANVPRSQREARTLYQAGRLPVPAEVEGWYAGRGYFNDEIFPMLLLTWKEANMIVGLQVFSRNVPEDHFDTLSQEDRDALQGLIKEIQQENSFRSWFDEDTLYLERGSMIYGQVRVRDLGNGTFVTEEYQDGTDFLGAAYFFIKH